MSFPKAASVVVIGGGVMGASVAYHLAKRGQKDIVLLEKEEFFGQGATGRCAGGVRYQFATEANIRLSLQSLPMLERFPEELGQEVDYRQCGYLFLLNNESDIKTFKQNVALQHKLGVQTEWLDGDETRKRLPQLQLQDIQAGTLHVNDGLCDPNGVVQGYIQGSARLGVRALTGHAVTGLETKGGRVTRVLTDHGAIEAPVVVNAAGPW